MMEVYICEDNQKQLEIITKYIHNSILIEELDMHIRVSTTQPEEILKQASESQNHGIFFLDINLKCDINGLQLAQEIRRIEPRCYIIFITSHAEMTYLTFQYKVEALDFIIKDKPEKVKARIHECLLDIAEKYSSLNNHVTKVFRIFLGEKQITIDFPDILFFETSANIHKIILHCPQRVLEFNAQMKDVEAKLDKSFYRCHRSYIINLNWMDEVNFSSNMIKLKTGDICPISIRMKKGLKERLTHM